MHHGGSETPAGARLISADAHTRGFEMAGNRCHSSLWQVLRGRLLRRCAFFFPPCGFKRVRADIRPRISHSLLSLEVRESLGIRQAERVTHSDEGHVEATCVMMPFAPQANISALKNQ